MTNEQRITNVETLDYTRQEAAFLVTVALHGGYFVARQFNQFVGVERGKRSSMLLAKLTQRRHAQVHTFAQHRVVVHLRHKPFYAAVGDPNSRNRREHQPSSIQSRLMALDYVLSHFDSRFLETDAERRRYFHGLGINTKLLPFSHRFPVRLEGELTVFSFVDSDNETEAAFTSFLRSHRRLFNALPTFQLDFVGTRQSRFGRASAVFENVLSKGCVPGLGEQEFGRLIHHFEDRRAFETRQTQGFDRARLDRLRDELDEFGSPIHHSLFGLWKDKGTDAVSREVANRKPTRGTLRAVELPFIYGLAFSEVAA